VQVPTQVPTRVPAQLSGQVPAQAPDAKCPADFMHEPMIPAAQRDQVFRPVRTALAARYHMMDSPPTNKEVDLLIVQDDTIYQLEFKKSASPGCDAARHFRTPGKLDRPLGPGCVICLAQTSLPLDEGVGTIPVGAI
jgi:hypothetical protein